MQIALGPILYYWSRQTVLDFYAYVTEAPVDIVYLGEVVCSRRHELRPDDWRSLAADLRDAGKSVVLSLPPLLESRSDLMAVERLIGDGDFTLEVNEVGALELLPPGRAFVAGPHLNVYNPATLDWFARRGAVRWVAPLEMPRQALRAMTAASGVPAELFAFGRMPLAFSARCFTARHHNLQKDQCEFRCSDDADGLLVNSRDGQPFLVLNGIQTQSAATLNLLDRVDEMRAAGVSVLRLSPQSRQMPEVVDGFRRALDGLPAALPASSLAGPACNGYWLGDAGFTYLKREQR